MCRQIMPPFRLPETKPSPYIGIDMIGIARLTSAVMTRLAVARHPCALMLANTASNFKSEQHHAH